MYLQQSSSNPESWDIRENEMTTARSLAETDEGNERKRVGSQQSLEGTSLSSDPCDAEVSTCNKKTVYTAFLNHFYFIVPISWPFFIELFPNHFAWNFNTTDLSYVCLCTVCSLCIYTYTHTSMPYTWKNDVFAWSPKTNFPPLRIYKKESQYFLFCWGKHRIIKVNCKSEPTIRTNVHYLW